MSGRFELLTGVETFYSITSALCPFLNVEWNSIFPTGTWLNREKGQEKAIGDGVTKGAPAAFSQTVKTVNSHKVEFSAHVSP